VRFFRTKNPLHLNCHLEWSTIVDAPVTYGMSLTEFKDWYILEYGRSSIDDLNQRLERVEKTGTSAFDFSLDSILSCNRAGPKETELTKEELIEKYCRRIQYDVS